MKIGIDARILEGQRTGVGRYLANLLKFWKNKNVNEFFLYFKDKIPCDDFLNSGNFQKKILCNPLGLSSNFIFQHFLLPYQLKKDKIDFLFSPFYLKPIYCPIKSSIVLHDISYEVHPEWFDFKSQLILRKFSKFSARTADLIFTVSNFSKKEIVKHYQISPGKIIVTHLALDDSFIKTIDEKTIRDVREKYDIKDKFILSVGSIFNRRHILEILRAFEKIASKHSNYQFFIIGKNHTYPFIDIDNKINQINKNIGKNVIVQIDFIDEKDLLVFYNSCQVCIYLSDYEGFGLPIIEAQFFGKPVITSYSSSLVEVGNNSVEFIKNNTEDEIYQSMEKVISDKDYRLDLVQRGENNLKRFDWEKCANKTLEKILNINTIKV